MEKMTLRLREDLIALVAGSLLTLAFAPFKLFPLAILSLAALLRIWLSSSTKQAFWRGWLFGIGLFSTGVYWVFISVHTYGNTSFFLALLITSLLIAILGLFPACAGFLLNYFFPKNQTSKILCAFPACWLVMEWARTKFLAGFPWLMVGYSQISSPLRGFAPILSVYGVSLAVVLSSALLVLMVRQHSIFNRVVVFSALAFIWILGGCLNLITWTSSSGSPVKVSLVQGNIPEESKWSPEQVQPTLDHYVQLTREHWDSQIVFWPESAIPLPMNYVANFLTGLSTEAKKHEVALITGIPIKASNQDSYYNAVIGLGMAEGTYTKHRLVPFGEYIPFKKYIGRILDLLQVPMSDFIPGDNKPQPILAQGKKIASFICYEIAFPEQVRVPDEDINMILTVSNDAWFGHSIAQAQHLEMAQMRALEMGRPVLFASNDGITAIINSAGNIQTSAPTHQSYVLTDWVQTTEGKTPWQRFAMFPILVIVLMLVFIARCKGLFAKNEVIKHAEI